MCIGRAVDGRRKLPFVNNDLAFVQVSDCLNHVFVAFAGGCVPFAVIHPTRVESACWHELADTMLLMSVVPCLYVILGGVCPVFVVVWL